MRTILVLLLSVLLVGCIENPANVFKMTEKQDGKIVGEKFVAAQEAKEISKDDYSVEIVNGLLTWWVRVKNPTDKRVLCLGTLTVTTANPEGCLTIDFNITLDAAPPVEAKIDGKTTILRDATTRFGEDNVKVDGFAEITKVAAINALVVPGAGCETSTGVKGNWPVTPLTVKYAFSQTSSRQVEKPEATSAFNADMEITDVERTPEGGASFIWTATVENTTDHYLPMTVTAVFTTDTGEKIEPRQAKVTLRPNEKRTIKGGRVYTKKPFRELNGKVTAASDEVVIRKA